MEQNQSIVVFDGKEIELLQNDGRNAITAEQLGIALEYSEPRIAVNKIFNRNIDEFVEGVDYTVTNLVTEAGMRESVLFFLDGIMLVSMLSSQPKAKNFRLWARQTLSKLIETGEIKPAQERNDKLYEKVIDYQQIALKAKDETIAVYKELLLEKSRPSRNQCGYTYKSYTLWTEEEDRKLVELRNEGRPYREIADMLERTHRSVKSRMDKLRSVSNEK